MSTATQEEWEHLEPDDRTGVLHTLAPFPIVVVSTRTNAITANQVEYFTFRPLRLGVAISFDRFSHALIEDEGEFVINVPTRANIDAVIECGKLTGADGDKFAAAGIRTVAATLVRSVCLAGFAAHIECRVCRRIDFEERSWFVGDVVAARKRAGHVDVKALICGRHEYRLPGEFVAAR